MKSLAIERANGSARMQLTILRQVHLRTHSLCWAICFDFLSYIVIPLVTPFYASLYSFIIGLNNLIAWPPYLMQSIFWTHWINLRTTALKQDSLIQYVLLSIGTGMFVALSSQKRPRTLKKRPIVDAMKAKYPRHKRALPQHLTCLWWYMTATLVVSVSWRAGAAGGRAGGWGGAGGAAWGALLSEGSSKGYTIKGSSELIDVFIAG